MMSYSNNRLCALIDLEFFQHGTFIRPRELGWIHCLDGTAEQLNVQVSKRRRRRKGNDVVVKCYFKSSPSTFFFLQIDPGQLPMDNDQARQTFCYTKYRVHGLNFRPSIMTDQIHHSFLPVMIKMLYQSTRTETCNVVGYKGGSYEKILLDSLSIPCFNLEDLAGGCPTIKEEQTNEIRQCGFHLHSSVGARHCASGEVRFYRDWLTSTSPCLF